MDIKVLKDKFLFGSKKDVLRLHLYIKLMQNGIRPYENDMELLAELYLFGGYKNVDDQNRFIELCLEKNLKKSVQSVRNTLSKYTTLNVLSKGKVKKHSHLNLSEDYIPHLEFDKIVLQHIISHQD